jgi:hypothetical protein
MAWWMPRGATQSPIACRAAPRFLSAREIASVERLPIDRTTVSTPSMRRWAPVNALATTTVEPSTATSSVCGVSVTPLRNRRV